MRKSSSGAKAAPPPSAAAVAQNGELYGVINRPHDFYGNRVHNNNSINGNEKNNNNAQFHYKTTDPSGGLSGSHLPYSNGHTAAAVNPIRAYYFETPNVVVPTPSSPHYHHHQQANNVSQSSTRYFANGHVNNNNVSCALPSSASTSASPHYNSGTSLPPDPAPQSKQQQPHPNSNSNADAMLAPKQYRATTTTITTSPRGAHAADESIAAAPSMQNGPQTPHRTSTLPAGYGNNSRRNGSARSAPSAADAPTYQVEHLASFAAGQRFGLVEPADGIQRLKQMEKNSAVYAQPMILKLMPDRVVVEEEDGKFVEQFSMDLVADPTAHQSSDPMDLYNNVLLFLVKEDPMRGPRAPPPEMHIFQCLHVSSQQVAEDLHHFIKGNYHRVRPGVHDANRSQQFAPASYYPADIARNGGGAAGANGYGGYSAYRGAPDLDHDDASAGSNSSEYFELDVNTLNRCFDDIERFVARVQSAALAQRELEMQAQRIQHAAYGGRKSAKKAAAAAAAQHRERSILQLRAQIPTHAEFYEIFQKFKLCLNLLAKLKDHIHEPNAPELLHFLFTPLGVTLDACHWGLGRNVAEHVLSPLLNVDACALLRRFLTAKEHDVWMALGKTWRTPPEEWIGVLPPAYRPVFLDGFAPYGYPSSLESSPAHALANAKPIYGGGATASAAQRFSSAPAPIHRGVSAPAAGGAAAAGAVPYGGTPFAPLYGHAIAPYAADRTAATHASNAQIYGTRDRSLDNLELERLNLEKERLEFERMKVLDKEQQLLEHERRLKETEARLDAERRLLHKEAEKQSIAGSDQPDFYRFDNSSMYIHPSPRMDRRMTGSVQVLSNGHVASGQHSATSSSAHANGGVGAPSSSSQLGANQQQIAASASALSPTRRDFNSALDISHPIPEAPLGTPVSPPISIQDQSPRQRAFYEELTRRRCKIVQVTYDRVAQNPKELTVSRGEYLEVLNDLKNWWECRNVHSRIGYVPHTILSVVMSDNVSEDSSSITDNPGASQLSHAPATGAGGPPPAGAISGSSIINDESTPDYVKQRQGRRGEFRYF